MKPNTVVTGQVSTRVCLRGRPSMTAHQSSNRRSTAPRPCRNANNPCANPSAPAADFTASRSAIFSNENNRLVRDSILTARAATSR